MGFFVSVFSDTDNKCFSIDRDGRDVSHSRGGSGSSNDPRSSSHNNNSAFEMYGKAPMSTFGKMEPSSPKSPTMMVNSSPMNSLPRLVDGKIEQRIKCFSGNKKCKKKNNNKNLKNNRHKY